MGPGVCFPLLSTQSNLDADGSQITGKECVPEPPGGCGWTAENGKKASGFELVGMAGRVHRISWRRRPQQQLLCVKHLACARLSAEACHHPHFVDEETEALRRKLLHPRLHGP